MRHDPGDTETRSNRGSESDTSVSLVAVERRESVAQIDLGDLAAANRDRVHGAAIAVEDVVGALATNTAAVR